MRKIVCAMLVIVMIASIFAGCEHNHKYGQWQISEPATYSNDGVQVRTCRCGETEEEKIPKLEAQTTKLKENIALEELQQIYDTSMDQPWVWFEESGWIYAYCKTNGKVFLYYNEHVDGVHTQTWYGYYESEYVLFTLNGTDTSELMFRLSSKQEALDAAAVMKENVFGYIPYLFNLIDQCDKFTCTKTVGDDITYDITLQLGEQQEHVKLTTVSGCITVYEQENLAKATYEYGKEIKLPVPSSSEDTEDDTSPEDPTESVPTDPAQPNDPSDPTDSTNPTNPGGNFPFFNGTEPEINYSANLFTSGDLDIALTGGSVGKLDEVTEKKFGQTNVLKTNLCWGDALELNCINYGIFNSNIGPAALTEDDKISTESVLKIPIYGADGRVQELAAITENATYQNDRFVVNDLLGVRAVGVFENGTTNDLYGYIIDLAFRSKENGALTMLTTGDKACSATFAYNRDSYDDEDFLGLVKAYRFVFFNTEDQTILATAKFTVDQQVTFTEKSATLGLTLDADQICELTANTTSRVSVLIYLDGNEVYNSDVFVAYAINGIVLDLGFTIQ